MTARQQSIILEAKKLVQEQQGQDYSGHDDSHVERVVNMARHLAKKIDQAVDKFLLELVCWLHDVDDRKLVHQGQHISAKSFLAAHDIADDMRAKIIDIIERMSYTATKNGLVETTIEGQIAQDADRLDAIGAIGIARAFAYGGAKGRPLSTVSENQDGTRYHFDDKLFKLEGLMNTAEAKRIAHERTLYMSEFIARFDKETKI